MAKSDEELVTDAKSGNPLAFDELVARHQERVYALAYRMLSNADDAADVQQETFMRAWTSLKGFRGQAAFTTWLYRITVNLCLSRRRRVDQSNQTDAFEEERHAHGEPGALACLERIEVAAVVRSAIDTLTPKCRALIVLREIEGRSCEEIAQIVGLTVEGVRTGLFRARRMLKERIRPYLEENA